LGATLIAPAITDDELGHSSRPGVRSPESRAVTYERAPPAAPAEADVALFDACSECVERR